MGSRDSSIQWLARSTDFLSGRSWLVPVALVCVAAGLFAAVGPLWVATFAVGVPLLALALTARTRFLALLMVAGLAPFMSYVKALTGIRYGPLVLDAALLVIALGLFVADLIQHGRIHLSRGECCILLFMALGAVQVLNPLGPGLAVALEGYRILVWQAVGYLLGRRLLCSRAHIRALMIVLRTTALVVAIYGIKQLYLPSDLDRYIILTTSGDPSTYTSIGQGRAFSTMSSPFHLGYFMAMMLLMKISVPECAGHRARVGMQIGILGIALLLTIVRTAWIGLLTGLVLLSALQALEQDRFFILIKRLALVGVILVMIWFGLHRYWPENKITQRVSSLANPTAERNYRLRLEGWRERTLPLILANPFGYGTGSDTTSSAALVYSHNGFFYIAIELGIPGLVLVLYVVFAALLKALRSHTQIKDPLLRGVSRWMLACWGAMLAMAMIGGFLEVYPVALYAWLFLGALDVLPQTDMATTQSDLAGQADPDRHNA
jgi:hypothetical protein